MVPIELRGGRDVALRETSRHPQGAKILGQVPSDISQGGRIVHRVSMTVSEPRISVGPSSRSLPSSQQILSSTRQRPPISLRHAGALTNAMAVAPGRDRHDVTTDRTRVLPAELSPVQHGQVDSAYRL